jgi:glucose/arabinose dehydrogenase
MKPKALFKAITAAISMMALQCVPGANTTLFAGDKVPAVPGASVKTTLIVPEIYREGPFKTGKTLMAPPGFSVSVFAAGLKGVRFMAVGSNGVIYASIPSEGKIVALVDEKGEGFATRVSIFAGGLDRPHGLAFRGKDLIVAETRRLLIFKDADGRLKADVLSVLSEDLPGSGGGHWTRTVAVGPDGAVYVSAGSSCNACVEKDLRRASVLRFAGPEAEIYARGLRNSVGIAFDPDTGELWGVDNGRDWLGDDLPPDELNRIVKGGDYGWPYCYGARVPDPELGDKSRCAETVPPEASIQAHSAPLGITFGRGLKFPPAYRGALFVAYHGSWNRSVQTGYKLVIIPFENGRPAGPPVDFITGWLVDGYKWGRPVDPIAGRDGSLYMSDDYAGAIYRITSQKQD